MVPLETDEDLLPEWISLLHLVTASTGLLPNEVKFGPYYGEPDCRARESQPTGSAYYEALETAECFAGFRDGKRIIGTEYPVRLTPRDSHDQGPNQDFSSASLKLVDNDHGHAEIDDLDNLLEDWSDLDYGIRGSPLTVGVFDTRQRTAASGRASDPRSSDDGFVDRFIDRPYSLCDLMASTLNVDRYYSKRIFDSCFWSQRAMFAHENWDRIDWTDHNQKNEDSLGDALVWVSLKDLFFSDEFDSEILESGTARILSLSEDESSKDYKKDVASKLLGEGVVFTDTIWLIAHVDIDSPETWNLISKYVSEASFTKSTSYEGGLLPIWAARNAREN
ncbi:hypothetical protein C1J02_07595 [Sulfitobacter sp. SK011]|nr:hypothetical protein C1J02_07595 [Sulfitobacter sp. SK011]